MTSLNEAQQRLEAALERLEQAVAQSPRGAGAEGAPLDPDRVAATEEVARRLDEVIGRLRALLNGN